MLQVIYTLAESRVIIGKKDRILHFKLERDSLMCRQEDLAEISVEMIQLTSNFNEIFNRLGTMQQIWTMVRHQLLTIVIYSTNLG
jgi:hypothetical protein